MRITTLVVCLVVLLPSFAAADEPTPSIRSSAERLAGEATLQQAESSGRSTTRMGVALGLVAAGVIMTLIDPTQPVQPTQPGTVDLRDYLGEGLYPGHSYRLVYARGDQAGTRWTCAGACRVTDQQLEDNYTNGFFDGADTGWFHGSVQGHAEGWLQGQQSVIEITDEIGAVVYEGPFKPFVPWKKRSPTFKYGGAAAAAAAGAVLAFLWRDGPQVSAGPTVGGARASVTIGF